MLGRGERARVLLVVGSLLPSLTFWSAGNAAGPSLPDNVLTNVDCGALGVVRVNDLFVGCTHGPDPAPPGIDPSVPRPLPGQSSEPEPRVAAALATPRVPCYGDGQSGPRVQAIYAYPADTPDRYTQVAPYISTWAAQMDQVFDDSAAQTGGIRHVRFVTDANCNLVIQKVQLTSTGDDSFGNTMAELRAMGMDRTDRRYLVWMDSTVLCGIAGYYIDDGPDQGNANNATMPGSVARVDSGCWGLADDSQSVEAHELLHTLGGVQPSAPNATPLGHCTDGEDRMCYDDGSGLKQRAVCPWANQADFDCQHDDYYSTNPPAGSYLATHWDTANSVFLADVEPPNTAPPPEPMPSTEPDDDSSSPPGSLIPTAPRVGTPGSAVSRITALRPARLLRPRQGALGPRRTRELTVAGRGGVPANGAAAAALSVVVKARGRAGHLFVYPTGQSRPGIASVAFAAHQRRASLVVVPIGQDGKVRVANRGGRVRVSVDVVGWADADGSRAVGQTQTLRPRRVLDTRAGIGGPRGRLRAGATRRLTVAGHGGVPTSGVSAVWLTVTASQASRKGSLSAYPAGDRRRATTSTTYAPGRSTSNLVLAALGKRGRVLLHNANARVALTAEVVGWVDNGSNAASSRFSALDPATVFDSQNDSAHPRMAAGSRRTIQVSGEGGVPSSRVAAVVVQIEAIQPSSNGALACYPAGGHQARPSIRYWRSTGAAQATVCAVSSDGRITLHNTGGATRVRVAVIGYFDTAP